MSNHVKHKGRRNASNVSLNKYSQSQTLPSQPQLVAIDDDKLVRAQASMISTIMKVSSDGTGRLIHYLQQRIELEESYCNHLERITGDLRYSERSSDTCLEKSMGDYLNLGDALCPARAELITAMKAELEALVQLKEQQDRSCRLHGKALDKVHTQYMDIRSIELPAAREAYTQKWTEIEKSQPSTLAPLKPTPLALPTPPNMPTTPATPSFPKMSGSASSPTTTTTPLDTAPPVAKERNRPAPLSLSAVKATSSLEPPPSPHQRFKGFMKKQFQMASHSDRPRQNIKVAKLRIEANDADEKYRKTVRKLNVLAEKRKAVTHEAVKALRQQLTEKSQKIKTSLHAVLSAEVSQFERVQKTVQLMQRSLTTVDPEQDATAFDETIDEKNFPLPPPIYYINYHAGECRDLMFGTTLTEYAQQHNQAPPLVVVKCIEAVEKMGGLRCEGIYRISGKQSHIEKIKQSFERDETSVVLGESEISNDVYTVATVLKVYLRELGAPLFPFKLEDRISYSKIHDKELRLVSLLTRILKLPPANYLTLKVLIEHLSKLDEHVDLNKMSPSNLSLIFTPAIFHDHNQAQKLPGEWFEDCVMEDLLLNHQALFAEKDAQRATALTSGTEPGYVYLDEHEDDESLEISLSTTSSSLACDDDLPTEPESDGILAASTAADSHLQVPKFKDALTSARQETQTTKRRPDRQSKFKSGGLKLHLGEISTKNEKKSSDHRYLIPNIVSATFPSFGWRSQDQDVPATPLPRLRRASSTGRKSGAKRKPENGSADIPAPPPHAYSTTAVYPPITEL